MAQTKYVDYIGLKYYDEKLKAWVEDADEAILKSAKDYADGLADNYDASGTAQTKVDALANGQVKANTEAITKLNGAETAAGSVAKAVKDAKDALTVDIEAAAAAAEAAQEAADAAQGDVDALAEDVGNVENLDTSNQTVVGAINEVLAAVGTGGTAAVVTITSDTTTSGALKSYTIKQGNVTVGVIDIPKDMVVESGEVVTNPAGQAAGTYIKLVLANVADPLYINVGTLVDIYKAKANASQVQIAIDSSTREISASIVAGSVNTTELADDAVVTVKIADANVTKAKLATSVQASLDKADAAATKAEFDTEVTRAKAAEAQALTDAKSYADTEIGKEKTRAEGIEGGLDSRIQALEDKFGDGTGTVEAQIEAAQEAAEKHADDLNTAMDTRVKAVEGAKHTHTNLALLETYTQTEANLADAVAKKHNHTNSAVLNGITAGKVTDWDNAAAAIADGGSLEVRIDALEGKVGDGFVAITNAEIDTMFA